MFTKELLKRNKIFIDFIVKKHNQGFIEPDTYFIDLDSVKVNAQKLFQESKRLNLEIFQMTKQFGRNPFIAKAIAQEGIEYVVAVDWKEAEVMHRHGLKIGNIGHIVQVPKNKIENILNMNPKYWTIFSFENLVNLNEIAKKQKKAQDVLIRVCENEKDFYPSQKGGIKIDSLQKFISESQRLKNIQIVGVTSFPCLLLSEKANKYLFTNNYLAVMKATKILKKNNLEAKVINIPSANCLLTLQNIQEHFGNSIEPGHAFTGTNPITSKVKHQEIPSILYYSQVSHLFENKIMAFAGGHYRRSKMDGALIGNNLDFFKSISFSPEIIDYYFEFLKDKISKVNVGDVVISSFRTQIFVTRSRVAIVQGLSRGQPQITSLYTSQGEKIYE